MVLALKIVKMVIIGSHNAPLTPGTGDCLISIVEDTAECLFAKIVVEGGVSVGDDHVEEGVW
jgi:hypothetical protein